MSRASILVDHHHFPWPTLTVVFLSTKTKMTMVQPVSMPRIFIVSLLNLALVEIWQFRFAAECVADVTARTLTAEAPTYAVIMDLDRKVRNFALPEGHTDKNDMAASFRICVLEHIRETGSSFPLPAPRLSHKVYQC